ncbi:hypothetical protein MWU52_10095 [Jannaschia sp. S6380]|uniref:hypothetical protein n=1 Tax=Jannaschia sp. S6380 TaxID=2926408 RepID=UPI001FF35303|nr:hypothetical protein [Jannaschia sp. S6380]MCK0167899.1 hypothetical protein [Jannaschia sp. S6380]
MNMITIARHTPTTSPRPPRFKGISWLVPALALAFAATHGLHILYGPLPPERVVQEDIGPTPTEDWHGNVRVMHATR